MVARESRHFFYGFVWRFGKKCVHLQRFLTSIPPFALTQVANLSYTTILDLKLVTMNIRRLTTALFVTAFSCICMAQPRSEQEATAIAKDFLSSSSATHRAGSGNDIQLKQVSPEAIRQQVCQQSATTRTAPTQDIGFYVFNDEANHCFVIVSGDKRQYETLGSSENGVFDPANIPCGLLTFLEQYADEYAYLQKTPIDESSTNAESESRRAYSNTSPLIKTKWGQGSPYNDQCPYAKGSRCVTGCVATAMAQVMNYYKYPERGEGTVKRIAGKNYLSSDALNLSTKAFDWGSMEGLEKITSYSSSTAQSAVAYLMKACGYAVKMDYGTNSQGGSGAYPNDVVPALTRYLGYKTTATLRTRASNYSSWESLIQEELSNKRPMIYCGYGTGGHCFILDGYQASTGKYYFNWGWNGSYDGAFYLSSLRPSSYNFTTDQLMIYRISPESNISIETPVINIDTDNDIATVSCSTEGVKLYYSFTPQDQSYESSYTQYNGEKLNITCNGTFRAYAELQGKKAYATARSVSWFAVYKPEFYQEGNYVTIKCPSATAIYYTYGGSTPTTSSTKYTGAIYCSGSQTIKAIGVKSNYTTSPVATLYYKDDIQTVYNINNTAGHLSEKISYKNWYNVISLTVSGQLNKDDMNFLTAVLAKEGELTRLDMKNASLIGDGSDYLPDNAIDGYAFLDCSKITSIVLPKNLEVIGYSAFENCTSLTQIDIPESCTTIGDHAFAGSGLTSLTIPKNVKKIDWGFVEGCKYLTSLIVVKDNKFYDSRDDCNAIIRTEDNSIIAGCKRTLIPLTVKMIESDAFCSSPKSLYIPENINSIDTGAFSNSIDLEEIVIEGTEWWLAETFKGCANLRSVTLPAAVEYLRYNTFEGCSSLKILTLYGEKPIVIDDDIFKGSNYKNATLRVPYGCKAKYQATAVWKDFGKIEEMDPVVTSIAEAEALQEDQYATLKLNDVQVTYAYQDVIDYAYIRDKSGAGRLFGSYFFTEEGLNIKTGDILSGSIPIRKSSTGSIQFISHKFEPRKFNVIGNKAVEPKPISADEIKSEENDCELVTVEGVVINSGTNYLYFYDSEKHFISVSTIGGLEPDENEAILAETKDKDLSQRRFKLTGIPRWQSSLYLTKPAKDIGPVEVEKGTAENPLTPAEANALAGALAANEQTDKDYYIHGFVYSIKEQFGTQYGNATFYLSADGTEKDQFYIYRALYLGNTKYAGQDLLLQVGDEVVVCGKLVNYLGTLPETVQQKAYVVSINGTATGIKDVTIDSIEKDTPIYNISGQRLMAPRKGINIINGKLRVIK